MNRRPFPPRFPRAAGWAVTLTLAAAAPWTTRPAPAQVTLQLLPNRVTEQPEEGPPTTSFRFPDPPGHVLYTPPADWTVTSTDGTLLFAPDTVAHATWRIEVVDARTRPPLPPGRPHDRPTLDLYHALALRTLPAGATRPEPVAANPSLIEIDRAHALEIQLRFERDGRPFRQSRIHLPHGGQQVVFTLTAPDRAFDALHRVARASLFTWQSVRDGPAPDPAPPGNPPRP